jgi:hypothetical protein
VLVGIITALVAGANLSALVLPLAAFWAGSTLVLLVFGLHLLRRQVLRPLEQLAEEADGLAVERSRGRGVEGSRRQGVEPSASGVRRPSPITGHRVYDKRSQQATKKSRPCVLTVDGRPPTQVSQQSAPRAEFRAHGSVRRV